MAFAIAPMWPQSESNALIIMLTFTWHVAAGYFPHIVIGSVEMASLIVTGNLGSIRANYRFSLPVLLDHILGEAVVFCTMAWGQVRQKG